MQRSKGFVAVMNDLESFINRRIVSRFWSDKSGQGPYRFRWTNLEAREETQDQEKQLQEMQGGLYVPQDLRRMRDERLIRDPLDRDLYQRIERWIKRNRRDIYRQQDKFNDLLEQVYENAGGEWALWPEAPVHPMLMTIWQAEHEQAEGRGEEQEGEPDEAAAMEMGPEEEEEELAPWDFTGERDRQRAGPSEDGELPHYLQQRETKSLRLAELVARRQPRPATAPKKASVGRRIANSVKSMVRSVVKAPVTLIEITLRKMKRHD
jgi:hypothetical protein